MGNRQLGEGSRAFRLPGFVPGDGIGMSAKAKSKIDRTKGFMRTSEGLTLYRYQGHFDAKGKLVTHPPFGLKFGDVCQPGSKIWVSIDGKTYAAVATRDGVIASEFKVTKDSHLLAYPPPTVKVTTFLGGKAATFDAFVTNFQSGIGTTFTFTGAPKVREL